MPYTNEQRQRIVQWMGQRIPRLTQRGCPLCAAPATGFGVEQMTIPNLNTPLLAIACRSCGYVMLFNESLVLDEAAAS